MSPVNNVFHATQQKLCNNINFEQCMFSCILLISI